VVLPLTAECVPLYLGIVLAGAAAVCIADSFAPEEIAARLAIGSAAAVVTQDDVVRDGRRLPLYSRVAAAADQAAAGTIAGGRGDGGRGGLRLIPAVVIACAAESCARQTRDDDGCDDDDNDPSNSRNDTTKSTRTRALRAGGMSARLSGPLLRRCDVTYAAFLRRGEVLLQVAS
jgi:acyl-CoA synthetase (AMP-forming)/AMP-acid ligase II